MVDQRNTDPVPTGTHSRGGIGGDEDHEDEPEMPWKMYLRFAAMILSAMVVMYWVMFVGSWEWSHVRFSASSVFMAITMGGTMGLVMLGWMLNMYRDVRGNIAIVAGSLLLLGGGIYLDRSQVLVDDVGFMRAMIPETTPPDGRAGCALRPRPGRAAHGACG
jgi:hypothetical protein